MIDWTKAEEVGSVAKNGLQKVCIKRLQAVMNGEQVSLVDVRIHALNSVTDEWKHTIKGLTMRPETCKAVAAAMLEAVGDGGGAAVEKETEAE